jgi:hypothetical protein
MTSKFVQNSMKSLDIYRHILFVMLAALLDSFFSPFQLRDIKKLGKISNN